MKFQKCIDIAKALQPIHHNYQLNRTFHMTFAFHKRKLLSIGINNSKTHPNIKKLDYRSYCGEDLRDVARMHSELNCILKLQKKINISNSKNIVYVNIRLDKLGNVRYARPCNGCSHLFYQIGYKKIFYSDDNGIFKEFHEKKIQKFKNFK